MNSPITDLSMSLDCSSLETLVMYVGSKFMSLAYSDPKTLGLNQIIPITIAMMAEVITNHRLVVARRLTIGLFIIIIKGNKKHLVHRDTR
jgi:hypothetical protein